MSFVQATTAAQNQVSSARLPSMALYNEPDHILAWKVDVKLLLFSTVHPDWQ
jgi:hypothetical protein